ncbi:hypothetical protein SAMN02746089_00047 [Caldanaerobius fijiensis DSM 17918]|uniref:Uncharacterized protein n=1 Tax=Caldanaerobius fijiensis DSM 17918 TaxID=1121256 RepID=A0A1M4SHQ0_9THEO|nr:hypothetical protein [Caldanaerobius fijiensis]SHE31678.1 hypothetical protein SAMN02746089_00047 [Caldanaerobius fijiensis DSM 17918]
MVNAEDEVILKQIYSVLDDIKSNIESDPYLYGTYRKDIENENIAFETNDPIRESIANDIIYIYKKISEATLYDKIIY